MSEKDTTSAINKPLAASPSAESTLTADDEWNAIGSHNSDLNSRPSESKLPRPAPTGNAALDEELTRVWADHMKQGFAQNQEMFRKVLDSFMGPYQTTVTLYKVLFGIGIGLFIAAVVLSYLTGEALFGLIFGGLGLGVVLSFFISQPLRSLEQNLQFIAWLGVSYNNYWTRLMHVQNPDTALADIKSAGQDFNKGILELIQTHAEISSKRPGSDISG